MSLSMRQRVGLWAARMAIKVSGIAPRDPSSVNFFAGNGGTMSGVDVNETNALNCSAIWAAVNIISSSLASSPVCFYQRKGGTKERVDEGRLVRLVRTSPNTEMTPAVFKETLQAHVLTFGNWYAEIERDGAGRPIALWPIIPNRVEPCRNKAGVLGYDVRTPDERTAVRIPAENMLHVPGLGFDGTKGYGVVRVARESFGLCIATERYGATLFGNGARPSGVLTTEKKLSPEAVQNLRLGWNEQHQGLSNAHRVAILHEGLQWQQMSLSAEDAQFLDTRKFQIEEVARWFNIPPHLLRHLERATFSNIEHQGQEYVKYTLMPWMVKWEEELNRKLLSPEEQDRFFFEFNADSILRGDMLSRFKAWAIARNGGWMSVNDVRARENENPLPDGKGDIYLVPENYQSVEQLLLELERDEVTEPHLRVNTGDPTASDDPGDQGGGGAAK